MELILYFQKYAQLNHSYTLKIGSVTSVYVRKETNYICNYNKLYAICKFVMYKSNKIKS